MSFLILLAQSWWFKAKQELLPIVLAFPNLSNRLFYLIELIEKDEKLFTTTYPFFDSRSCPSPADHFLSIDTTGADIPLDDSTICCRIITGWGTERLPRATTAVALWVWCIGESYWCRNNEASSRSTSRVEALLGDLNSVPEAIRTTIRNNGVGI